MTPDMAENKTEKKQAGSSGLQVVKRSLKSNHLLSIPEIDPVLLSFKLFNHNKDKMNKVLILLFTLFVGVVQAQIPIPNKDKNQHDIVILDGAVTLALSKGKDFPCIGIQLSDNNINIGLGTYLEIKKKRDLYYIKYKYQFTGFSSIDKAVEAYLEELFKNFYSDEPEKYAEKVWKAFLKEGGLHRFLSISKGFIDNKFLNTPFNETYG